MITTAVRTSDPSIPTPTFFEPPGPTFIDGMKHIPHPYSLVRSGASGLPQAVQAQAHGCLYLAYLGCLW
jgi:hypothetical protein